MSGSTTRGRALSGARRGWGASGVLGALVAALALGSSPAASQPAPQPQPQPQPAPSGSAPGAAPSAQPAKGGPVAPTASASGPTAPPPPPASGSALPPAVGAAPPGASAAPTPPGAQPAAPLAPPPRTVPPPPPPTQAQLDALAELEREAATYEKAAKDYRSAATRIVQHHYEERRKRVLSALDSELAIERKGLMDARVEAIKRLEEFVRKYSGPNAHPESTPTAMFRLAALYEERARDDESVELAESLLPAIAMYKRIIREFPQYKELAGVYYFLGHALADSARLAESQQVWRSLVCHNRFPYPVPTDPKDADRDTVARLPQDHEPAWWNQWELRHPDPPGAGAGIRVSGPSSDGKKPKPAEKPKEKPKTKPKPKPGAKPVEDFPNGDEMTYIDPYPVECEPLPQKVLAGQDPKYVAEVWWRVGDYHFNEIDAWGGPYNLNRAESAYRHSLKLKKPPVYGVAMYKLAWTYFKQQRYETSIKQFLELLKHTDEQEKLTGDPGTDFRTEAYTYIAASLTYLDFLGPEANEPYIARKDVLDVEQDPKQAELRMRVAIDRVQNEQVIPQKEKWTVNIYKALAQEFNELKQLRNTIEIDELILKKWPMDRDAPVLQNQIADIWETIAAASREGTVERQTASSKALEARTKLSEYVGTKPWVQANKDDPEALQTAERLVRGGLRRAAADHTNRGSALKEQAIGSGDRGTRDGLLERALTEYRLAAQGWQGYLEQDPNSPDAYESRFWIADANFNVVVITVALDRSPSQAEVDEARKSAVAVRDSNEDDKYLQPAAYFVVATALEVLKDQYKLHKRTGGSQGLEQRDAVKTEQVADKVKVVKENVPPAVLSLVAAYDEYVRRVPANLDQGNNLKLYPFAAADYFFLYGQFDDARKRFEPIYANECGKTEYGFRAWERLLTMANLEENIDASRKLAEAQLQKSCAVNEEQNAKGTNLAKPTISLGYYVDAGRAFEKASKMPDGPERNKAWREAAALYKVALEKAPARDEAPEAAMNGAFCYKQVGDYDQAIAMYSLFIKEYGSEENLKKLEKGDSSTNPPKPPDPKRYGERVKFLKQAYDALAAAYVLFFNYRSAAETFETISKNTRFDEPSRRLAGRSAVLLWVNLGEKDKTAAARTTFFALNPPAEQKADVDFLVASTDLKQWDENGADEGGNRAARMRAIGAMDAYYNANKANPAASAFAVQAAYYSAKLRRVGKDAKFRDWCKTTVQAFDKYKAAAPKNEAGTSSAIGSFQSDMAAECAYRAIDEKLKADWDYETGHHKYTGVIDKVAQTYDADLKKANDTYFKELQAVIDNFGSRTWAVAARARQGTLYDACRTGLFNSQPKLYTDKEEKLLKLAEESGRDDLQETADEIRQRRREQWRTARSRRLEDADRAMVKFYVETVVWSRAWKVRNDSVNHAIRRLAFFTDIVGDPKLREYSQGIQDPVSKQPFVYTDGVFLRSRPGLGATLKPDGLPTPLPVVP